MNPLENQRAADEISGLYQDLEERLMSNIVRHCRDYGQPIDSDVWLMKKLAEIGNLNRENIRIIAESTGLSNSAIERLLIETAERAAKEVDPAMQSLVRDGLARGAPEYGKSKSMQNTVSGFRKQARDTLNLCNTTMLYKARDAFKRIVQNIASDAKEIEGKQSFIDVLNRHTSAAVLGAESRQQAVRKCIKDFNERGIPAFIDKKGREWTPEAYVNMAVRNTIKSTADEVQSERCLEYGVHLIEIDSHSGARPKCAKDQGKIYDLNNKSGYIEDANGRKVRYYPWNSSSYGEPDGILGINCTHHKWPFVPGVSLQSYFPVDDAEKSDQLYKDTQLQRALERDVRKQKRECMLYDQLGDEEGFKEASVKLKQKEEKLTSYVNSNRELYRRRDREQVVGFDKSISMKAAAANKRHVEKYTKYGYNKNGTIIVTDDKTGLKNYSVTATYKPYAVVDNKTSKGSINRTVYDADGRMVKQINPNDHGNPKNHPYGINGEHVHDIIWEDGKIVGRPTRELTEKERKEHRDIL
jgi:hypothetical protein